MKSKNVIGISILGLATTMLMSVGARAEERVENETPKLTGILKYGVTQFEAETLCRESGMRLPTARELALISHGRGAQGISETAKDGYELVKGSDSAGNPDHFYFNSKGYQRPADDRKGLFHWTSSIHHDGPDGAYVLDGDYGNFDFYRSYYFWDYSVRCVQ